MEEQAEDKENSTALCRHIKGTSFHETAQRNLSNVEAKIYGEIESQQLHIARNQRKVVHIKHKSTDQQASIEQIRREKALLKEKLLRLGMSEAELKKSHLSRSLHRKQKSTFTPSDVELIKKLQKSFKDFEREVTKKSQAISTEDEVVKERRRSQQREMLLKAKQERRKQAQQWLDKKNRMKSQSTSRMGDSMKSSNSYHHTSSEVLYLRMDKLWRQRQLEQIRKLDELRDSLRKRKRAEFENIKIHEQKHEEQYRQKGQERGERLKKLAQQHASRLKQMSPPSKFYQIWREEQLKKKQETEERELEPWLKSQKKVQYGKAVRSVHLPQVKCRENPMVESKVETQPKEGLGHHEQYLKGNEYLASIKQVINHNSPQPKPPEPEKKGKSKYPNYLTHKSLGVSDEQKILRMLDEKDMSALELAEHTRRLAHKLDEQAKHNPKRILQNIQTKLNIISKLSS